MNKERIFRVKFLNDFIELPTVQRSAFSPLFDIDRFITPHFIERITYPPDTNKDFKETKHIIRSYFLRKRYRLGATPILPVKILQDFHDMQPLKEYYSYLLPDKEYGLITYVFTYFKETRKPRFITTIKLYDPIINANTIAGITDSLKINNAFETIELYTTITETETGYIIKALDKDTEKTIFELKATLTSEKTFLRIKTETTLNKKDYRFIDIIYENDHDRYLLVMTNDPEEAWNMTIRDFSEYWIKNILDMIFGYTIPQIDLGDYIDGLYGKQYEEISKTLYEHYSLTRKTILRFDYGFTAIPLIGPRVILIIYAITHNNNYKFKAIYDLSKGAEITYILTNRQQYIAKWDSDYRKVIIKPFFDNSL